MWSMTSYDFTDRTALVTGGTRGIGYTTARLLATSGANVLITGRKAETVEPAAEAIAGEARSINPRAGRVIGVAAHVADPEAAKATCALATDTFGSLDILVNNAGTNPAYGPVVAQSPEIMTKVFQINTIAPAVWAGEAIKAGLGEGKHGGVIINVSSIGALTMEDHIGVYNASKAALLHLTKQMARELAPKIRVNAISPGVVRTKLSEALWKDNEEAAAKLSPLRRIGEPDDIAEAIAFLAGDSSRWVTGENLVVDGGMLIGG